MQIGKGAGTVFFSAFGVALIVLCTSGRDARADIATHMGSVASSSLSARAVAMTRDASFAFERNIGQTGPQVKFLARAGDYTPFLTLARSTLALRRGDSSAALHGVSVLNSRLALWRSTGVHRSSGDA